MNTRIWLMNVAQNPPWERGYAVTSPKEILDRANVGQRSMYHHFSGERDLATAALKQSAVAIRAEAEALLAADGMSVERVISYLERRRNSLRGCRMGRMTYDADVLATPELLRPIAETLGWIVGALADVVHQGIEAGEFWHETDPEQLVSMVVATVKGGYVSARAQQNPAAFDAAVAGATSFIHQQAGG